MPIVPVLITGDVDFSNNHEHRLKFAIFDHLIRLAESIGLEYTLYFTANEALQMGGHPKMLNHLGHEIGCHGLTHGDEEEYDSMPIRMQRDYLRKSTDILSCVVETDMLSFRAPRVKISSTTYQILTCLGYLSDSSVCSQRMDLISSNLMNTGWLYAPRLPYHPSDKNPYCRGDIGILAVPVSAIMLPFISSVLYVFGLGFMKLMFNILYTESLRTGKPIVYLFHPYEFIQEIEGAKKNKRNTKVHGFGFRRRLYRGTPASKLTQNTELWSYMKHFKRVRFMTMRQYVAFHKYGESGAMIFD